jgi:alpha-amylase/alpha-mannosidase (GH57 family)
MTETKHLDLILCWHMHQPDYRDHTTGEFVLPWTYLHAIKDYTDMAWYLEQIPNARAVFNFVPILLDQLEDYTDQFATGRFRDPLLQFMAMPDLDALTAEHKTLILASCFRANQETMIDAYPAYKQLQHWAGQFHSSVDPDATYLSNQFFADLLMWYHLTWLGETVRRGDARITGWLARGKKFSPPDRHALLELIGFLITGLIPRYRALLEAGKIELSTTPHYHPIAPLLLEFASARESWPEVTLPESLNYSDGAARVQFHLDSAGASHRARFGVPAQGIWPAEGGLSHAVAELFAGYGYRWTASGEAVLRHSLGGHTGEREGYLYRPYRLAAKSGNILGFFRDDRLSDKIGFAYAKWRGKDAALDFVEELEGIADRAPDGEVPVVSIIMDGENAWEYYPYNGFYFLSELYQMLTAHTRIRLTTFSDVASAAGPVPELRKLTAGSWVYGTFSTWIGDRAKNHAWDLLCAAKQAYDERVANGLLSDSQRRIAERQLASCEASDWFWWPGDYNPSESVKSFDLLYRQNLSNLYRLLELPVPSALGHPLSVGAQQAESSGAMRRVS